MKHAAKKWSLFALRWGIAVAGIWYVVSRVSLDDEVVVFDGKKNTQVEMVRQGEPGGMVLVREKRSGVERAVLESELKPTPGLRTLVRQADRRLLAAAVVVFPIVFVITAYRWNKLLAALSIRLTQARTFTLTMVGAFYNTFMPGSTGGDLLKAYYASKQTHFRTRAVMSVIVDRVIGLIALILLGGVMSAVQYFGAEDKTNPAVRTCGELAAISGLLLVAAVVGSIILHRRVRAAVGIDRVLRRLPLQKQVQSAIEVVDILQARPGLVVAMVGMTLPVQITVVLSAMLAGMALGLPLPARYYFVAVPAIALVGAIPISPQGLGVMEVAAYELTKQYGTTVSQAFALTMSIRLVQIFWSLLGGIFVFRGGYHAPSETEQEEMTHDDDDEADEAGPAAAPAGVTPVVVVAAAE